MSNNSYIQSISYAKLAEYDSTRTDLPIRKYVLITNLLREEEQQQQQQQQQHQSSDNDEDMLLLEQHWFETCLNELDKEEEEEVEVEVELEQSGIHYDNLTRKENNVQLHAIYNIHNGRGFLVCTSNI